MSFDKRQNNGASLAATGLSSATPIEPVPVSPVPASIPSAADIDDAVTAWHTGAGDDDLPEFLGWSWNEYVAWCHGDTDIPQRPLPAAAAQAMEARRAETLGSVHESAVGETDAHDTPALEASSRQEERLRSALERLVSVADLAADTINTSLMDEAIQQARAALEPPHAKDAADV